MYNLQRSSQIVSNDKDFKVKQAATYGIVF